jgi:hypothetical protein
MMFRQPREMKEAMNAKSIVVLALASGLLSGCAINSTVKAVETRDIAVLCVQENPQVLMQAFHGELAAQIEAKGIKTRTYKGAAPAECRHRMEYSANWRWDFAMYLFYANLTVWEADRMVGQAVYDARLGGLNLNKFGGTAEKIRPLLDELFPGQRGAKVS